MALRLLHKTRTTMERCAFLLLLGLIVVVSSEKFYWYPQGFGGWSIVELAAFYALPVAATLVVIERFRVAGPWAVAVVSSFFALGVEGIITPVVYEDGPLPVMALYFLAWHGLFSFTLGWYLVRRWALAGQRRTLAVAASLQGLGWGLWSATHWRQEGIEEFELLNATGEGNWDPGQWPLSKFAAYAMLYSGLFIAAHWLIGFVWPRGWQLTRRWRVSLWLALGGWLALVAVALPWAPIKFAALCYITLRLLAMTGGTNSRWTVFDELRGLVPLRNLAPVLLSPVMAIGAYGAMVAMRPSQSALDGLIAILIAVKLFLAAGFVVAVIARARRRKSSPDRSADGISVEPAVVAVAVVEGDQVRPKAATGPPGVDPRWPPPGS